METFFEIVFPEVAFNYGGDTQVCCPFPHSDSNGNKYYESRPSAGINLSKDVFHCFSCNTGVNEIGFIAKYMGLSYANANKFKQIISHRENAEDWEPAHKALLDNPEMLEKAHTLGFSDDLIKHLRLGFENKGGIAFPIFLFGQLIDVSTYRPGQTPKLLRRKGSVSGMLAPYDIWQNNHNQATILCAGEKDMAIARAHGLNSITVTGGELALPELLGPQFTDRTVYIIYDNDDVGRKGAKQIAVFLKLFAKRIKIIDLSGICTEKGEDLWDYFMKYRKTKEDLNALIKSTPDFDEAAYQETKETFYPTIDLLTACLPEYVGKIVRSNVQVLSTTEAQFQMPSAMTARKMQILDGASPKTNQMKVGDTRTWFFTEANAKDLLYLVDSHLKQGQIETHKRTFLGVLNEENVQITVNTKETVFKCSVTDTLGEDLTTQHTEIIAYSLNTKMESGQKYRVTYKLVPHPFDGQKLIMIVYEVETVNDEINNFLLTPSRIEQLKKFQVTTTLDDKIHENIERVRGMLFAKYNAKMVLLIDLFFHSVLQFNLGNWKSIKGTLDVLLVGESRTGKTTAAEELLHRYGVGQKIAMPTATTAGLIGGSNIVQGTYQTRAGLLPMNHGGAVILEELGKAKDQDIIKMLTEIKTSGIARIARVNGLLELPCMVRILSITNAKVHGTSPKPISSYPNGISVVTDLIGTAEDIARFDVIAVFAFTANEDIEAFPEFLEPHTNEDYRTKIHWIWSRKPHQIVFEKPVYEHLIKVSNVLKNQYDSHIKIFGTETWKKIARIAIALAGYVVSTDETFENIVVQKEHIDYAATLLESMYDNRIFRFKEFVAEERRQREIDDAGIANLQKLYTMNPTLILHLENSSTTSRNNMAVLSGMPSDQFTMFINSLVANMFINFDGNEIHPTERFRKGMDKIDRRVSVRPLGEVRHL